MSRQDDRAKSVGTAEDRLGPEEAAVREGAEDESLRLRDLRPRDYLTLLKRSGKEALADRVTDVAAAIAYYTFLAIPAVLLVGVGLFSLVASPAGIERLLARLETVAPAEALSLLDDTLTRIVENQGGGLAMVAIGFLVALWTASGAMSALIRGLNVVYDQEEQRGFAGQRLVALAMLACLVFSGLLVFGLLVLGPHLSRWIGSLLGLEGVFGWIWWTAQWPILIGGLLLAFGAVLYIGPNLRGRRFGLVGLGALIAAFVWLVASGLFAVYVSMFGSYNKAWGSLAAVIVMLIWLWLSSLAILFGAEVNSEARRFRPARGRRS